MTLGPIDLPGLDLLPGGDKAKPKAAAKPHAATLTPRQIAGFAQGAGFRGRGLVRAVAVALAESGGKTNARNTNSDGTTDRGLLQFNSKWHPEVTDAEADNPAAAMAAAFRVSKHGEDWSQWATWPVAAGAQLARARMAAHNPADVKDSPWWAEAAAKAVIGLGGVTGALNANGTTWIDSVKSTAALVAAAGVWMADPHNWARVAFVVGGGAVVIAGLAMLAKSGAAGQTAQGAAKTATKTAKTVTKANPAGAARTAAKTAAKGAVKGAAKPAKAAGGK